MGTGRIQCEVLTTLPFCISWIKKFLGQQSKIWVDNSVEKFFRQPSENLQHRWSNNLRKNLNKLHCATGYWLPSSLSKFFLKLLDQRCWRFSKGYLNNFSTELSTQIFDCCPRNFLIQEEMIGDVVSTSHWIRPVVGACHWRNMCEIEIQDGKNTFMSKWSLINLNETPKFFWPVRADQEGHKNWWVLSVSLRTPTFKILTFNLWAICQDDSVQERGCENQILKIHRGLADIYES